MEPISTTICSGIAGKIAEYSVEPIKRQVDYVIHCKSILALLEKDVNDLTDAKSTIEGRIAAANANGAIILEEVNKWVEQVEAVTRQANQLKDESQAANLNCVNGCSLNLRMRRQLSKQSIELVDKIARLILKKDFPEIARGYHREEVAGIPTGDYMPFDSRESAVEQIMDELKNPNNVRIGVCGIGGVGKTTLVKQVFRKAKQDASLFDKVAILLDVKSIPDLEGIQKQIVEKLEMGMVENETIVTRGGRLCAYIKGKKILIILDDVQTEINLERLGVPGVPTCKILLTSRIPIYGMSKGFKLGMLQEEEAWELFANKAVVLDKVPAIQRVAKDVAKKCGGLPVLVVTVASSLKDKNELYSWENALRCLKEFDHKDKSPEKKAHSTIEWTYNQLDDSMLEYLFLLCGTTVRGNRICLEDLFKYTMGLKLFKNVHTVEHTRNAFYSKVKELKDFCLLLDEEDDTSVRMQDIVRDAARRIALRDHHMLSAVEDGGDDQSDGKGWPNKELTENCTTISFPSANNIPQVLQCPALKMLLLQGYNRYGDSLKNLPRFFEGMKQLRVLSLKRMDLPSLPSSLQFLNNLQTLCLHYCRLEDISLVGQLNNLEILSLEGSRVKQLPKEIGQLTRLRLLDLTHCYDLEVISPGVISSLTKLEELRMRKSFKNWKPSGDGSNVSLCELKHLSQLTSLEVHVPDANILPADFLSHELKRFQIMIGDDRWYWDYKNDRTLNTLKLKLTTTSIELERGLKKVLKICDDLLLDGTESVNHIVRQLDSQGCPQLRHLHDQNNVDFEYIRNKGDFPNLTRLVVSDIDGLRSLLSSSTARILVQLTHLQISRCPILEDIVSTKGTDEENMENMFSKLQHLELESLPNLTRFCSRSYMDFPSLKILQLDNRKEIEEMDSKENLEDTVEHCLFDKKVRFPKLERLTINYLPKFTKIWGSQLSQNSFCKLRDVTVQQCNSLINIVPDSIAGDFQQLQKLTVETCGLLEEIVAEEEGETLMPDQFVLFPKVTCLKFRSLPQLKRFYPRKHALNWRLLKTLELFHCRIVDIFASGFSGLPKTPDLGGLRNPVKQPFVLIEKSSFPNLEDLTLGPMDIWYDPPAPAAFCKQAVFPGISSRHTDLKTLRLHGMEKLTRLWEEKTEPAGPVFLQLEALEVKFCGLKNQKLSAISFKNLTSLEVSFCWRLQYLTTYSVAQSLGQLEKLKVDECKSMKEILANDGVGEDASNREIDFKQLRHLELSDLISLERFCSRNCTVKIPLLETSALVVNWCSLKLKISSNRTLEEVDSKMHLNVQKSHSRKEAGATTEVGSLETNQKQLTPNASEGAQDIESEHGAVNQETTINSQNMEHAEYKVTNTSKNLQEADSGRRHRISKLEGEIRDLQEELRNKEQKLADERLATVDPSLQEAN